MSLVFDTLKLSKSLGRAFTPEQAEVLTEALTVNVTESLATKSDLAILQSGIDAKIADAKSEMIRRIVGASAFNLLGTAGLMFTIAKLVAQK